MRDEKIRVLVLTDCCHSNMSELAPEQQEALPLDIKRIMTV